jgi:hypothetical protein
LHDKDKIEAHKKLFLFARKIQNQLFPMAEGKRSSFCSLMEKEYFNKIDFDSVYYTDEVLEILAELESRYTCMTRKELIPEMDEKEEDIFIEEKLFKFGEELCENIRKNIKA